MFPPIAAGEVASACGIASYRPITEHPSPTTETHSVDSCRGAATVSRTKDVSEQFPGQASGTGKEPGPLGAGASRELERLGGGQD